MTALQAAILVGAGAVAGVMNAAAGGGSFVSFPALMYVGIAPRIANATNTVALWPGSVASVSAYRRDLGARRKMLLALAVPSVIGGLVGASLLLNTPEAMFVRLLPFLMLAATILFTVGPRLTKALRAKSNSQGGPRSVGLIALVALQLVVAVYGGYFGGGIGILMLAALGLTGMENIHAMNALKTVLASLINGVAVVEFIAARAVQWPQCIVMLAGAVCGGYFGAYYARKLPQAAVRGFVIGVGATVTMVFFARGYA